MYLGKNYRVSSNRARLQLLVVELQSLPSVQSDLRRTLQWEKSHLSILIQLSLHTENAHAPE